MNILFVCLGNICRSPIAAGIMRNMYNDHSLAGIIESAGTADFNIGRAADYRAIAIAKENGIDIRSHRARQICIQDFHKFEHIFVMDAQNKSSLLKFAPDQHSRNKIELLAGTIAIADPYSADLAAFREAFALIKEHCASRLSLHPDFRS